MRIALLEDDLDQSVLLSRWLAEAGHQVSEFADGSDFLRAVLRDSYDLLLLDWELPGISGFDVLRRYRRSERRGENDYTPIVFITIKGREANLVQALEAGADDYIVKPVRRRELLARIKAVTRKVFGEGELRHTAPFVFDEDKRTISVDGEVIELTYREYDLALFLFRKQGRVISRTHLLESIWGRHGGDLHTRTVDTHISRLRKKLGLEERGWKLTAVYQQGYRLEHEQ